MPIVCVVLFYVLINSIEMFIPDATGARKGPQQRDVVGLVLVVIAFAAGFASSTRKDVGAGASKAAGGAAAAKTAAAAAGSSPGLGRGCVVGVRGFMEGEDTQWQQDSRTLSQARQQGIDSESLSAVMGACTRCDRVDVALEVFDLMLENGLANGLADDHQTIDAGTAAKFFQFVAVNLDEQRARESGLGLLEAIRSHGLAPTVLVQNRLICAWRGEDGGLPEDVARYLLQMQEEGLELSAAARRCLAVEAAG